MTEWGWTDKDGVEHRYPSLFNWDCIHHGRSCYLPRLTGDDILRLAAKDEKLADDTFVVLRQAVEGREIGGES